MAVNNIVKRLQNIMRQDAGINGDAQRIEQMTWMFFLKVYDTQEETWGYMASKEHKSFVSITPEDMRWRNWAVDEKDEEEILPPAELLADYYKKRKDLDHETDKTLAERQRILGIEINMD